MKKRPKLKLLRSPIKAGPTKVFRNRKKDPPRESRRFRMGLTQTLHEMAGITDCRRQPKPKPMLVRLIMLSIEYLPDYGRELVEDVCFRPIPTMRPNYYSKTIRMVPQKANS